MTTQADSFLPAFNADPYANFRVFQRTCVAAYRGSLSRQDPLGGLFVILDDAAWAAQPGNTAADGAIRARPAMSAGDILLPIPGALAAGATHVEQHNAKATGDLAIADNADLLALHARLVASLPTATVETLADPLTGMANVSHRVIYAHCLQIYGVVTADQLKVFDRLLLLPMGAGETYETVIARHSRTHAELTAARQSLPEYVQVDHLVNALVHVPYLHDVIKTYWTARPAAAQQSFASLCAHLRLHAPNFQSQVSSLGYGSSLAAQVLAVPSAEDAFFARLQQTLLPNAVAASSRVDSTSRIIRPVKPRARNLPVSPSTSGLSVQPNRIGPPAYCWAHGYTGHSGQNCRHMTTSQGYTTAHRAATSPIVIDGTTGSNYQPKA